MFAIDFLSDIFGKSIKQYLPSHISGFANFLCYIVNREIELANNLDKFSIESMVKDGVFGAGAGLGHGEHLITIQLSFREFQDEFEWDLCNPDNQPEDFAASLVADLGLNPAQEFMVAITYEIKK